MLNLKFDKEITALLVIDPYNDFIEGVRCPEFQDRTQAAMERGFQTRTRKWPWPRCWAI